MLASELAKEICRSLRMCNSAPFGQRLRTYQTEETRLQNLGVSHSITFAIRYSILVPCTGSQANIKRAIFKLFMKNQILLNAVEDEFETYCQSFSCTLRAPNQTAIDMSLFTFINDNNYSLVVKNYF